MMLGSAGRAGDNGSSLSHPLEVSGPSLMVQGA